MKRSTFISLMIGMVMAVGLFASFAEAGTLAINQTCYATQPQANLTAINTTTDISALAVAEKRSTSEDATLILANTHLKPSTLIGGGSSNNRPAGVFSVHRSTITHIFI